MALSETEIIQAARDITGNTESLALAVMYVPDEALMPLLDRVVLRLGKVCGNASSRKEIVFQTVAGQQDYKVSETIGSDVESITSVTRSGSFVGSTLTNETGLVDPTTGRPASTAGIQSGYQRDVFDVILGMERFRQASSEAHELVTIGSDLYLRLMPCPTGVEQVEVRYVVSAGSISSLPDAAKTALTLAMVVAIIDGQLNRISSMAQMLGGEGPGSGPERVERILALKEQKKSYISQYEDARLELANSRG